MKERVLLAMSGGIDSSMALVLLQQQGYEVVGATYRTWDYISESCMAKNSGCCSIDAIYEAKKFAEKSGVEHHILDYRDEFRKTIIQNFVDEYASGKTPNPCVLCNFQIKWGLMLETADKLNCKYISTGHYAGVRQKNGSYILINAKDTRKDQTYFLWMLNSMQLSRTLFPLYGLKKNEVRKLAEEAGFVKLTEKKESQEICFVTKNNYRDFLAEEFPEVFKKIPEGNIFDSGGKLLGKHKGFINYTIGQRKGVGIATGEPVYVTEIHPETNTLSVGKYHELQKSSILVKNFNLNGFEKIPVSFDAEVKIRYNTEKVNAKIFHEQNYLRIDFQKPVYAVTPGQSAVFYSEDELLGGGIIQ